MALPDKIIIRVVRHQRRQLSSLLRSLASSSSLLSSWSSFSSWNRSFGSGSGNSTMMPWLGWETCLTMVKMEERTRPVVKNKISMMQPTTLKWTDLAEDTTNRKMRWSRESPERISKFKAAFLNRLIRISKQPWLEWRIASISCRSVSFASMPSWTSRTAVCYPVSTYFTGTASTTGSSK